MIARSEAMVVLPDHLDVVWTRTEDDAKFCNMNPDVIKARLRNAAARLQASGTKSRLPIPCKTRNTAEVSPALERDGVRLNRFGIPKSVCF
jgi:hypothetical protein